MSSPTFPVDAVTQPWYDTNMTTTTNTNTAPICRTCELEPSVLAGTATAAERNAWAMWGCTCDPAAEADALAWFQQVTR